MFAITSDVRYAHLRRRTTLVSLKAAKCELLLPIFIGASGIVFFCRVLWHPRVSTE